MAKNIFGEWDSLQADLDAWGDTHDLKVDIQVNCSLRMRPGESQFIERVATLEVSLRNTALIECTFETLNLILNLDVSLTLTLTLTLIGFSDPKCGT